MTLEEIDRKVQFIVHVWLDAETVIGVSKKNFSKNLRNANWVRKRLRIFKDFTLRSLLNQDFDNFRIFLFCGKKHRSITEPFDFGTDRVEKIYDYGLNEYMKLRKPYVSVMRIDSDDLFHRKMMSTIRQAIKPHSITRTSFSCRRVIQWNILHNFVTDFFLPVSPFTNHVFPRRIYRNVTEFRKQQFMGYRTAQEADFPRRFVCIVRHKENVTWRRIGKDPGSEAYKKAEFAKRNGLIVERKEITKIVKNYGIPESMVGEQCRITGI